MQCEGRSRWKNDKQVAVIVILFCIDALLRGLKRTIVNRVASFLVLVKIKGSIRVFLNQQENF